MSGVDERDQIATWKFDYFRELGCDPSDAQWLAMMGVDPHDLDDLLKAGCPWKLAKRILTPV